MLLEQSREPATDPAVFEVVAKGACYQASRLRVRTIDDLSLPNRNQTQIVGLLDESHEPSP
jgi:hypothetical protein